MENWKVELATGVQILAEVKKIQKSILLGDSLSMQLFIIPIISLN